MTPKLQLRKATRSKAKLRVGFGGPSGSGKTYSALLVASGMTSWDKIAVIDTENGSADLYQDMTVKYADITGGHEPFNVIPLTAPFSPERYIEAIKMCEDAGIEIIIIDSITHEWDGKGGCLEIADQVTQASTSKNSYTAWAKVTPRHNAFVQKILQSPCHIFTCVRKKQDYDMSKNDKGRTEIVKVGMKEITREGFEYELTLSFDLNILHYAKASKDRTELFMDVPEFKPTQETGMMLTEWANTGAEPVVAPVESELPAAPPAKEKVKMITKDQADKIFDLWLKVCSTEDPAESQAIRTKTLLAAFKVDSTTKLTETQADKFIAGLEKKILKKAQEQETANLTVATPQEVADAVGGTLIEEKPEISPVLAPQSDKAWEKNPPEKVAKVLPAAT